MFSLWDFLEQTSCGNKHTLVLDSDGNVYACGANESCIKKFIYFLYLFIINIFIYIRLVRSGSKLLEYKLSIKN